MKRSELVTRTRSLTRDFNGSAFRDLDVIAYINEGIRRVKQIIPQFRDLKILTYDEEEPRTLPEHYHHLLAVYSASRLFSQDERFHQAATLMNEFEVKLDALKTAILNGEEVAYNQDGTLVDLSLKPFYVKNNYFFGRDSDYDDDDPGVEGVPY